MPILPIVKLLVLILGSLVEFVRALADIRKMLRKMLNDGKTHVREAVDQSRKHYHERRGKPNA